MLHHSAWLVWTGLLLDTASLSNVCPLKHFAYICLPQAGITECYCTTGADGKLHSTVLQSNENDRCWRYHWRQLSCRHSALLKSCPKKMISKQDRTIFDLHGWFHKNCQFMSGKSRSMYIQKKQGEQNIKLMLTSWPVNHKYNISNVWFTNHLAIQLQCLPQYWWQQHG